MRGAYPEFNQDAVHRVEAVTVVAAPRSEVVDYRVSLVLAGVSLEYGFDFL